MITMIVILLIILGAALSVILDNWEAAQAFLLLAILILMIDDRYGDE